MSEVEQVKAKRSTVRDNSQIRFNFLKKILFHVFLFGLVVIITYMVLLPAHVSAANSNTTNENITTTLTIQNTNPTVDTVLLTDSEDAAGELDLSPATTVVINCSGVAGDINGVADISLNATLYHSSSSSGAADNYTSHYTLPTGSCTELGNINITHLNYNCNVSVWFHADPGTWTCNVTAWDIDGGQGNNQDTETMGQLLAIDVDNTLDFGAMAIGADSGTTDYNVTVYNDGNIDLDIILESWGRTRTDNLTMNCTDSNITENWLRYSNYSGNDWDNKISINNTAYTDSLFNLDESQNATGNPVDTANKTTYWGIGIPTSTNNYYDGDTSGVLNDVPVDGTCSGFLSFTAILS